MTEPPVPGTDLSAVRRPLPNVLPQTKAFWTGGEVGELRFYRCTDCGTLLHPSQSVCRQRHDSPLELVTVSGQGHVIGVTVNQHYWLPDFPPPYVVAIVAILEQPSLRLITNIVGTDPAEVTIGMPVRVTFAQQQDVWFPLFEADPDGDAARAPVPDLPRVAPRPLASPEKFEDRVAITGIGMSQVGRRLMRPPITLTVEAVNAAVADAGLTLDDIDGLSTYPGGMLAASGHSEGGVGALEEALGIHPTWINGGDELQGQTGSIMQAMLAVASGLCRHVLCFRTVWEATNTELMRTGQMAPPGGGRLFGEFQYRVPYGAASASNWIAMYASQYFHRFGASRETLGWIAVNARANAARNPAAIYREPMTMDDYLAARMISTPFGLYDCDVPCDGAVAIIVSAVETAGDLRQRPILVEAVGAGLSERQSWDQGTVTHLPNVFGPASALWTRTSLRQSDVDVALLYDGFSFNALTWLEGLGFCGVGEAPDFLEGGKRIALDGELPMNTHGGQLSAGRLHGYGFFHEAVVQLRGDGGPRQVPDARVAAVGVGGGVPAGCFLLRRD